MPKEKIALLGFGDIAQRLAPHLNDADITGVRRTPSTFEGVAMTAMDCRDETAMTNLMAQGFDVIVMSFTPTEMSEAGYQQGYVETTKTVIHALNQQAHQPRLLLFVSSTSVYGQKDGSQIDEHSPTEPNSYSGRQLLEAEGLLAESGYTYSCVRFSGIYGPGRRRLIDQVIAGQGSPSEPVLYSNRIHSEDCAAVLAHLISLQQETPIKTHYLATDSEPVPLHNVKNWIAEQLGFDSDHLKVGEAPGRLLRSSKRCSNQRLLASGYQFKYPTFREGYGELLQDIT